MYSIDRPEVQKFATEKRLGVQVEPNTSKSFISIEEYADPYPSLYFRTCLEELTRNYLSYTIAAEDSPVLDMEDSKPKNSASLRFPTVEQLDNIEPPSSREEDAEEFEENSSFVKSRFLRVYHPHATPLLSNFRRVPVDNKRIVGDWSCGYTKVLLNVGPSFKVRYNNHVFFEPLFGSVSLYSMNKKIDTDITKITECFHFDATPPSLRESYRKVYKTDLIPQFVVKDGEGDEEKLTSADPQKTHPLSDCSRCLFCVPTSILETHNIFLVVQLTKVLTGDPDKVLLPYICPDKKSFWGHSSADALLSNAKVSCNRLNRFRQPVGISVVKLFEADGSASGERKGGLIVPVYAAKTSSGEYSLKQLIQDLHAEDLAPAASRPASHRVLPPVLPLLDVCLTMLSLGTGGDLSCVPIPEGMPSMRTCKTFHFLPAQYLTEEAAHDFGWYDELGKEVANLVAVKTVLPLLHPSCTLTDHTMSGFRASIDNSIFLYPSSIENLPKGYRNLCARVQLVEFEDAEDARGDTDSVDHSLHNYKVLKNIYSTVPGDFFCQSAYTSVLYHKATPELNDEIKIRLPLKLNGNHSLFFQFFHIHVKNKGEVRRSSILGSKNLDDRVLTLLGSGHLPLLENGNSLLSDGEHIVPILESEDVVPVPQRVASASPAATDSVSHDSVSSMQSLKSLPASTSTRLSHTRRSLNSNQGAAKPLPVFTLHTRALCSFHSHDEDLQDYLTCHPPSLGHLPSLSPAMMKTIEYTVLPKEYVPVEEEKGRELSYNSPSHAVNEGTLKDKTIFLTQLGYSSKSTKVEVCKHFFGIMRQLTRAMCGGGQGVFSTSFANPKTHSELRCTSFIAMLRIFDIVTPKNVQSGNTEHDESQNDQVNFLQAYVNYMFDEEVYTYISPSKRKFDENGDPLEKKGAAGMLGGKLTGLFSKSDGALDTVKQQDKDELEAALLEHIMQQVETVVLQGSVISAVGKASAEILNTGTIALTAEEQERCLKQQEGDGVGSPGGIGGEAGSTGPRRWWRGCSEVKSLLAEMTESPQSLKAMLLASRKQYNPLKESIVIEPILAQFDRLDGFSLRSFVMEEEMQRKKQAGDADSAKTGSKKKHDPHNYLTLQWWPWMYEVISYQWIALLHIFQDGSLEKQGAAVEEISKIDEEEEGEGEEDDGKEALEWNSAKSYPLAELKEMFERRTDKKNEIRVLLIHHGPVLLSMIIKSIALRIHRELKSTPVIMDKDFMELMEELLATLAQEVHTKGTSSLLPARNLNIAVSHFLRDMFALIAPLQSAQLVYAYFLSSRKIQKINFEATQKVQVTHITDRFYFLKELILTDHFFAFNFPLHLGSPHAAYRFKPIFSLNDLLARSSTSRIRGIKSPPSHWLAHLLIYEVMCDFNSLEKNLKESAMKLIRSLVVRLSYDKRFQSNEYKHRVAAMFIPLLSCIVEDAKRIQDLPTGSEERKDSLALVLFLLQDVPDYLLREEMRNMMKLCAVNPIKLKQHHSSSSASASSAGSQHAKKKSSHRGEEDGTHAGAEHQHQRMPIFDLLALFHLVVDTFEFPLSPGGESGDMSASLSPSVCIESVDSVVTGYTKKGTIGAKERGVGANALMGKLENLHGNKQARPTRVARKRVSGDKSTGLEAGQDPSSAAQYSSASLKRDESPKPGVGIDAAATLRPNRKTGVLQALVNTRHGENAAKHVSSDSTTHVLSTLRVLLNESIKVFEPSLRSIYCDSKFNPEMTAIIGHSLTLLLHLLHTKQSEDAMRRVYYEATRILATLGAKNFICLMLKDTLQYWMRQTMLHCGSMFASLREAAASFLGNLLHSCFDSFGSFRCVCKPLFAVLRDVLSAVQKQYREDSPMLEDDKYLAPFFESFAHVKKEAESNAWARHANLHTKLKPMAATKGLFVAFDDLFASLRGLLHVYSFLSLKIGFLEVGYDWRGGPNTLDSVDYDDSPHGAIAHPQQKTVGFNVEDILSKAIEKVDMDWILESMINGSDVLADYELPRVRMYLLENLARMQDRFGNNAEAGAARWEIYLTMQGVEQQLLAQGGGEEAMSRYWCPRPPLRLQEGAGDFMSVLNKAISLPAPTAWQSEAQFYKHMVTVLTVCAKRFKHAKLTFLAERAFNSLITCYRRENFDENESMPLIAKAHQEVAELYATSSVGKTMFAMGTFYRVQFLGKDVSESIRNKEYVVRNADFLHLSEFQTLIKKNLKLNVREGVTMSVLPDTAPHPPDDAEGAFIVMTALKPILEEHGQSAYSKNCLRKFQFSVPFTEGGKAHAKTIDLQWKRTIYIEVPRPFPCLMFRQSVSHRASRDLSPIEVAIDDIQERNVAMRLQLQLKSSKNQEFVNNLMRLVQGTVAPQVNAGATEVAKTFLPLVESATSTVLPPAPPQLEAQKSQVIANEAMRKDLKIVLVEFLKRSKCLLERAREVLGTGGEDRRAAVAQVNGGRGSSSSGQGGSRPRSDSYESSENSTSGQHMSTGSHQSHNGSVATSPNQPPAPPSLESPQTKMENHHMIWQQEMDRGYDILLDTIYPYVQDIVKKDLILALSS